MGMIGLITLIFFIAVAVFALIAPKEGLEATCPCNGTPFSPPSWGFPFGTDNFGRSVFTLTVWGTRISLLVGLLATAISMLIGSVVGIVAGYYGRWPESVLMRLTDWFLVIPFLPLAIVLAAVLGRSLTVIIFVIGVTTWPSTARIIRAQVLSVKTRPYVERSRALGSSSWHLTTRHILPNVAPLIFANTILTVALAISGREHARVPGAGRPALHLLGHDPRLRVRRRGGQRRPVVVADPAGPGDRVRRLGVHAVRVRAGRDPQPEAA